MFSPVEEIKNRLDIIDVISDYIKLQKAGRNFKARCPFHTEKTPSFFVSPERQIWHCFGCNRGGDIFGFVKEIEGIEFVDALRILAQKAGIILKKQDPKFTSQRQRLYEICELATKFFIKQLEESKIGKEIKKYLLGRGLSKETIGGWRLGYAPDSWDALSIFLRSRGYNDEEIVKSGLVVEAEKKGALEIGHETKTKYYDRFRNRIIFPIFDLNSRVIGFAGRIIPQEIQKDISRLQPSEEQAKYINTPQTPIYDKSRISYGLDRARMAIRERDFCIIVEGYTDVLMSHQAGFKNTIATCGTALTVEQLKIIKRYTENLILAFDMDIAGEAATKRAIDLVIAEGFNTKIIKAGQTIDKKEDPAEIIKKNPKLWTKKIKDSEGIIEYYFSNVFSKYNSKEVMGKKQIAKILLPVLKKIPNIIEQSHWIQELAKRLHVSEKGLIEAIKKTKTDNYFQQSFRELNRTKITKSRRTILEEELLAGLLFSHDPINEIMDLEKEIKECGIKHLFSERRQEIFNAFKNYLFHKKDAKTINLKNWLNNFPDEQSVYINQLLFNFEIRQVEKSKINECLRHSFKELKKEIIRQKLSQLRYEIQKHEETKAKEKLLTCLKQFTKLSQKLIN